MDFHAAMETFAEAWVAANTQTVVNPEGQPVKQSPSSEDLPTQLPQEKLQSIKTSPTKQQGPPGPPCPAQLSPSSSSSTKSLPIHCIIEQTSGQPSFETSSNETSTQTNIELDSYAILPGTTLLSECVRAALMKLGYNASEAMGAKGAIQIKNWKPLHFESITDEKTSTIDDILGELTQVATLRIRICSEEDQDVPTEWTDHMVRCAVQLLLKEMNQSTLAKLSPLSQSAISNIANWKYSNTLSTDKCREFGNWFKEYRKKSTLEFTEDQPKDSRLTFHPDHEIPQMRLWYNRYKNPSETKLNFFAAELNKGHVRQERPKITINKLKNWWKNERQREKRISMMEDSKEKEEKEIETLRSEATKSKSRKKFLDQDKEMVKVAKVVPSPQRSLETRSRSKLGQGQHDPVPSSQESSLQQLMPVAGVTQTVSNITQTGLPRVPLTPNIIAVVDRPSPAPRGFVSLLQQSQRPGLAGPVARINPTSPETGLATTGPGVRINNENVQIWSGADGSEIRTCDIRPGQIGQELHSVSNDRTETSHSFQELSSVIPDQNMRSQSRVEQTVQSQFLPPDNYRNWNYDAQ